MVHLLRLAAALLLAGCHQPPPRKLGDCLENAIYLGWARAHLDPDGEFRPKNDANYTRQAGGDVFPLQLAEAHR